MVDRGLTVQSFHNTTDEDAVTAERYELIANGQESDVLSLFDSHEHLSPSECWNLLGGEPLPITSVRRAISNLTNKGLLVKTSIKVAGVYGRAECIWKRLA